MRNKPFPKKNIKPMLATLSDPPFDDPDWIFEIKWDGYRAITHIHKNTIQIFSRNHIVLNEYYPEIMSDLQRYRQDDLILDGEIVALDKNGLPKFQWLQNYRENPQGVLRYFVFDLLFYQGRDLRDLPLIERKFLLSSLIKNTSHIHYCDHIKKNGIAFFKLAQKKKLEGIIAKKAYGKYYSGKRSREWLKLKSNDRMDVLIAGYTLPKGSREYFGSLVLAIRKNKKLIYVGHSGGGFTEKDLKKIYQQLKPLEVKDCPFKQVPPKKTSTRWVKPILECQIQFSNLTEDGLLRHPIFLGIKDKSL